MDRIDIIAQLGNRLLTVAQPSRYTGGEYTFGQHRSYEEGNLLCGICFPDLYEIGMSNHAMRILYNGISSLSLPVLCDRVFAVAPDFETLLKEEDIPLYTLDYGIPLKDLDFLGFSIGYELSATNILQVLDLGRIPLHSKDRTEGDPIVIGGGPAVTNPLPFAPFFDFIYIGESEHALSEIITILHTNSERAQRIKALSQLPFLWYEGKKRATKVVHNTFTTDEPLKSVVVPNMKVAQDNGVVEIMRGCPNGCRFCHAGQYYKPYRQKELSTIAKEVALLVDELGYREITLSSLSSGDHPQLGKIITYLNGAYADKHISFALPSLKVSSFSLGILENLGEVRKSGLTFAIETPKEEWQKSMNKEVLLDQVISIIVEAKQRGWRLAKFYFMIGLPCVDPLEEEEAIVHFLSSIWAATHIHMNINIGTFIPKPHTPFQWGRQLTYEESKSHLISIKKAIVERIKGAKVSYHDPYISRIEGLLSRGGASISQLIERAYKKGARLDAWNEYLNRAAWDEAIAQSPSSVYQWIHSEHDVSEPLPWDSVSLGISSVFLQREWEKAKSHTPTDICTSECEHLCGVCGKDQVVQDASTTPIIEKKLVAQRLGSPKQVMITYKKSGKALYISHIHVMRIFEQAFQRASLSVSFTQGYNPKPKIEFVNPLSMGVVGHEEILLTEIALDSHTPLHDIIAQIQTKLPSGFTVIDMLVCANDKRITLSKYLGGSLYRISNITQKEREHTLHSLLTNPLPAHLERIWKEDTSYMVVITGEHNPIKVLFGKDCDKFSLLSTLHMERIGLFVGPYSTPMQRYHTYVAEMWQ